MALREWVRVPTDWIDEGGLKRLLWIQGEGSDNVAALMSLTVIAHHADENTGLARITYEEMCGFTGLSRAKMSGGLGVLERHNVITRNVAGRSTYLLTRYKREGGWGKLPAKGLYSCGIIAAFEEFTLRRSAELNALKLYYLFVQRRDNKTNMANISYEKIHEYIGVDRNKIKQGLSLLAALGLVHIEHVPSEQSKYGISNAYRLAHLSPFTHMGTRGRGMTAQDFAGE